jgi:hypothetical protein
MAILLTQEKFGNLYHIAKENSVILAYYKYTQRVITNKLNIKEN